MPYPCTARAIRSTTNCSAIWANPDPSAPTRLATGTRHDANPSSAVSEQCQPIFARARSTVNPARALLDDQQRDAGGAGTAGPDGDRHEVRAHAAGDEGLGAVDDVRVAVAASRRADGRDVGAAVGLGDRQGADLLAGQRGTHEPVHQVGVARRRDVRQRDPAGEERSHQPARRARLEHRLLHRDRVQQVAALAAHGLGERDAEQPLLRGREVQRTAGPRRRPPSPGGTAPPRAARTRAAISRNAVTAAPRGCPRAATAPTRRGPWPAGRTASRRPRPGPATRARRR